MTLDEITRTGIDPALQLLPAAMDSPRARVQVLANGLQESGFEARRQLITVRNPSTGARELKPLGPATSYWQMERGGGVLGVLTHRGSKFYAQNVCKARGVDPTSPAVWAAIEHDDVLAAAFARLLLWTDPLRLPALGDVQGAWNLYARTWRPGKPHPEDWPGNYRQALDYVLASQGKDL